VDVAGHEKKEKKQRKTWAQRQEGEGKTLTMEEKKEKDGALKGK